MEATLKAALEAIIPLVNAELAGFGIVGILVTDNDDSVLVEVIPVCDLHADSEEKDES
jgi:hypothetical protein